MQYLRTSYFPVVVITTILMACSNHAPALHTDGYVPPAPDYSDQSMWIVYNNNDDGEGADVFYIPSTWEFDWTTTDGTICHYADITNPSHLNDMATEMNGVAEYMAEGNNFFSPYYRHITLDTWATLNEDTISSRYGKVSFIDIQNAFGYFQTHLNQGRPFILAGFSQGAKSVVELMKTMPEDVRERMIAAYVLGYKVTPDDVKKAPGLRELSEPTTRASPSATILFQT